MAALQPDRCPILVCRLECPAHMLADVDGWMPKHFDDSLADSRVLAAASYAVQHDFRPLEEGGLPAILNGHGNRFIVYVVESIEAYEAFIDSEAARSAIADGAAREARYPPLDDEPFNGVVYTVREVRGATGSPFVGAGPMLVERFEVSADLAPPFDAWLEGPHLEAAASVPGAVRIRTWAAHRGYPRRFPYDRYRGKGNRMIWIELREGVDVRGLIAHERTVEWLSDSVGWDVRLPYVRREVGECLVARTGAEAQAVRAPDRRPS